MIEKAMSVTKMVTLTSRSRPLPAASRIAAMLARTCSACASIPGGMRGSAPGTIGSWPDRNRKPLAATAWL